jgi:hypothetical protein
MATNSMINSKKNIALNNATKPKSNSKCGQFFPKEFKF